jgi:hypothetical protein
MKLSLPKLILFIDSLIIFLNIAVSYSIIPYLLFTSHRAVNNGIIAIINVIYLFARFGYRIKAFNQGDFLFLIFILINIINVLFGIYTNTYAISWLPLLLTNITFYLVLINLFKKYQKQYTFKESIDYIMRGYIWFCLLNMASAISMFLLITLFDFNPLFNDIGSTMDLFTSNLEQDSSRSYYFPLNLSIVFQINDIRLPFFQKYGIICGFFHEPHTLTFVLTPAILYMIYKTKNTFSNTLLIVSFILVMLIAASTTNILSVIACLFVFLFFRYRKYIIAPIIIISIIIAIILSIDPSYYLFIINKLGSRSADYSLSIIEFAFTPKTLVGTSFYNLEYWNMSQHSYNVGYIVFFLNIIFLSIFVYKIIKLLISKNINTLSIGLISLYFFLHSTKVAMVSYSLTLLIFIIFLLNTYSQKRSSPPELT